MSPMCPSDGGASWWSPSAWPHWVRRRWRKESALFTGSRERRSQAGGSPAETAEIPPPGEGAQILDGPLRPGPVDEDALDRHADQLAALRGLLLPYVEGDRQVEPRNSQLVDQVEAARLLLEEIYRQHITFEGE